MKELYIELSKSKYDAFQYRLDNNCYEFRVASDEANIWMELGFRLEKNNMFNRQAYIALVYASELFLKSILNKCNIEFGKIHDLFALFSLLNSEKQKEIVDLVELKKLEIIDDNNSVVECLNVFEDFLKYISKYFINLRYDFEKIGSNMVITVPIKFINDFVFALYSLCEKEFE